ncbi:hypothetical protein AXF42_Ash020086 [Apostasia shenzhenica]|uniref:Uncharacterized protein n=1 Tax=Apostasia shenzhenica TaxID=1088818 RepID=A0A2I0APR3_9ASPA|nr:hypothetical protein AXF42_Ash020086 [Apostasia shenzhenica]
MPTLSGVRLTGKVHQALVNSLAMLLYHGLVESKTLLLYRLQKQNILPQVVVVHNFFS